MSQTQEQPKIWVQLSCLAILKGWEEGRTSLSLQKQDLCSPLYPELESSKGSPGLQPRWPWLRR